MIIFLWMRIRIKLVMLIKLKKGKRHEMGIFASHVLFVRSECFKSFDLKALPTLSFNLSTSI